MERVEYQSLIIQDLVNLSKAGELDYTPWYQRRAVWTRPQKSYLINTLFENKPIPSLYVRHYLDVEKEKSIKEVVDGQQRVRTVLEYIQGKYGARHPNHDTPVRYNELSTKEKKLFLMTSLSVGYLMDADDSDVIEIFGRLNSVAKTLNAQELRNAKHSGEFKQFCLKQASSRIQFWRDYNIFSANDIARMKEVEFISEIARNMLDGLGDFSKTNLDNIYKKYDEKFSKRRSLELRFEKIFQILAAVDPRSIRDTIFSRNPIFFSLFHVLDSLGKKPSVANLERTLFEIDERFETDIPVSERTTADANFYLASTQTTQRIKSRAIRDSYLRERLAV